MIDAAAQPRPDPRRWITLAIVISAVLIVASEENERGGTPDSVSTTR
jgi:hypothetical protein